MKLSTNYIVRVLATGFVVLILLSIPLFWIRFLCNVGLYVWMPYEIKSAAIEPSGLLPDNFENDPNIERRSRVSATMESESLLPLGITEYFESTSPGERRSCLILSSSEKDWAYFDNKSGQFVFRYTEAKIMPDSDNLEREVQYYIGPEGISEIPDKTSGRFIEPIADSSEFKTSLWKSGKIILYDKKIRRFFAINLEERIVTKGQQLSKDDPRRPIDIGILNKNDDILDLYWMLPTIKTSENNQVRTLYSRGLYKHIGERDPDYRPDRYILVLDKSGRIDLLDKETLELSGPAGFLPTPKTLFPTDEGVTPDDLLAYRVLPVALKEGHKYRGLFAAAVNREGTSLALDVFDEKGALIGRDQTWASVRRGNRRTYSSRAVLFGFPGAPAMTISKFMLENLHPPILSLASYFTAESFEAGSGHRALFLLPNSFIAMKGRDARENIAVRFMYGLLLISPSIALAILLALCVNKDAAVIGLSRKTKRWWLLGTIAFGLAGYITYKLIRPKITLVTCANCGKPRRPDMNKCHRCGSKWNVPELTPPGWRVLNGVE
ncbi:hypothetical protein ACFL3Q_01385 [Planctomycetota bacterium]